MSIYRRPFGVEQESVIPLFVDGEDLPPPRLPLVGELLEKMFKRQKIRFTKVWLTVEKLFSINIVIHARMIVYPGALETLNSNSSLWTGRQALPEACS